MNRFALLTSLCAACLLGTPSLAAAGAAPATIAIQPLGKVPVARVAAVKRNLEAAYGASVCVLPATPLPQAAWYAPRQRYRAEKLLDHLEEKSPQAHRVVVGLTAKDISTTKDEHEDWGIFGLGQIDGRVCVVSTFRLGARGADEARLLERLRKVAIHEAGHVMGLPHCPADGCVMRDAAGTIATVDTETGAFCADCQKNWQEWLKRPGTN